MSPGPRRSAQPCYVSVAYTHAPTDPRVRRHCETLQRRGWRVYQVGLGTDGEPRVGRMNGVVLIRRPQRRYRGSRVLAYVAAYAGFLLWATRMLRRVQRRWRIDVVQANNIPNTILWSAMGARRRGAALVLDMHDPVPELFASKFGHRPGSRWLIRALEHEERLMAGMADVALCVHETHRQLCLRRGIAPHKLRVVMNLADERFFPLDRPREPRPFVMYHGTVARRMGLEVVLEAIDLLRRTGVPARGAFWGDGDAVSSLRSVRDRLALGEIVEILGRRLRLEELVPRLREGGIGVVTVVRDAFTDVGLPTKLMEYVRLGIPVVVTWTPTIAHYFPENTVEYVRDFTPSGVAAALTRVLSDPGAARERAARAQRLPAAQSWQEREAEFAVLIDELGSGRAR